MLFKTNPIHRAVLTLASLLCFAISSSGQSHLKGKVTDGHTHLPSVTILLFTADSTLVKGVVTDTQGEFVFEQVNPGDYLITASMVGYTKFACQFSMNSEPFTLPDIFLKEETTELGEVVVSANKLQFDQKIDRLVINLEGSITSSGNTMLEVLQKSPGLTIDKANNRITMNGRTGVRIMINDKVMNVPLDAVVQMLDGMSTAQVEAIELITTPPAKYDADGNGGIIHIITKENTDYGTQSSVGLTLGARWAEHLGGNFSISRRGKNFGTFLDYSILRNHNMHISDLRRQSMHNGSVETVVDKSPRENITTQQNLNAGVEWNITERTVLSALFTGYKRDWEMDAISYNKVYRDETSFTTSDMKVKESNIWQSATGSLGLQTTLSKNTLSGSIDYLYYHNDNPSFYDIHEQDEQVNTQIDLRKNTPIRILIARADYQREVSSAFSWEAGVKAVSSRLDNDVHVQRNSGNEWTTDSTFTSYSNIKEEIAAAYIAAKWQTGDWQLNGGLRYEYTHTSIGTPTEKNLVNRKYGYFFPSVSLKKSLGGEKDFQFSYTRRITRPTYNDIAPYVFFWGPNSFSAGNTSLYPAIADALTAGVHLKAWNATLYYSHTQNEIVTVQPEIDDESNSLILKSQNLRYLNTLGLTNAYSANVASWWTVQASLTVQYQVARTSHLASNFSLDNYSLNLNLTNQLRLPKNFSMEISGIYQSRQLSGTSYFDPLFSLNAGIQKDFGKRGILRLSMDDILYATNWRITTDSSENNLDMDFKYDWHNQFIRLTYTCNLGNLSLKSVKVKSGSEEERRRVD